MGVPILNFHFVKLAKFDGSVKGGCQVCTCEARVEYLCTFYSTRIPVGWKVDSEEEDDQVDEEIVVEPNLAVIHLAIPSTPNPPIATPVAKPAFVEPEVKVYKPKIPFPQRLRKDKLKEQYGKFMDIIKSVYINVSLVDLLSGMPSYAKFIKDLVIDKRKLRLLSSTRADIGASINLIPFSVYRRLSLVALKPTRMSIKLTDHSFQYPMGIAENLCVKVGHIVFLADFVILEMEEDAEVPFILGRPFLYTTDVIIRVKDKVISLGRGNDRISFSIDKPLQHPYSCNTR
uniref:uncharacterized protein LOC122601340 n=1 Tax=Erigeron canadensis TaxID=72917 RepID=UPI001CB9B1EE|nr:uncharacterized protein LOC122601340 [Erigeron canadensis]